MAVATEHIYSEPDANGVRRLLVAAGHPIPASVRVPVPYVTAAAPVALAPWAGYDDQDEAAILAVLATADPATVDAARRYEQAHAARGTITTYDQRSTVVGSPVVKGVAGSEDTVEVVADTRPPGPPPGGEGTVPATTGPGYDSLTVEKLAAETAVRGLAVPRLDGRTDLDPRKQDYVAALQADDAAKADG